MKVKRVKIGVRPPGAIFDEATQLLDQLESGKAVQPDGEWLYFSNVREMGKVLTPRRLELLKAIRDYRPDSIRSLASVTERNVKNVAEDLGLLVSQDWSKWKTVPGPGRRRLLVWDMRL